MVAPDEKRKTVNLPARPFLYTLAQVCQLTALSKDQLEAFTFYDQRTLGTRKVSQLMARNVATPGKRPIWRVAENELLRWLKAHRYKVYDRNFVED